MWGKESSSGSSLLWKNMTKRDKSVEVFFFLFPRAMHLDSSLSDRFFFLEGHNIHVSLKPGSFQDSSLAGMGEYRID